MSEHPILFSAPMVRALLADRKHVTRRIATPRMKSTWLKVKAGDRLWVRETWRTGRTLDNESPKEIATLCEDAGFVGSGLKCPVWYDTDGYHAVWSDSAKQDVTDFGEQGKTRVSIHMPRWASRILLECEEDARLERLQEITEEDAIAEGVEVLPPGLDRTYPLYCAYDDPELGWNCLSARDSFTTLWKTLHTKPGERWEDNPEVVRVGRFRRIA